MLSVMLLIGAGLLMRSFTLLADVDPGFRAPANHVVTMFVSPTVPRFDNHPQALAAYWDHLLERVRAIPGVEAASLSNSMPPDRWAFIDGYEIENKPLPLGSAHPSVPVPAVSQDYFRTLGILLLRGRWFDRRDTAQSPPVTVISEALARRHFAGENPTGQHIRYGSRTLEIVGVGGRRQIQRARRAE
jgi:putative ABC transport system permease protein